MNPQTNQTSTKKPTMTWAFLWNMARPRGFEPLTSASGGRRLGSVWSEVGGSKSLFVSNLQAGRKFKKVLLTPLVTRFIPSLGTHLSGWRWLYLDRMTTASAT